MEVPIDMIRILPLTPTRVLSLTTRIIPVFAVAAVLLLGSGLYTALIGSPADLRQGETVRIMYVHVPSAWIGMLAYCLMAAASAAFLIWRHPLADLVARAAAPLGAAFTFLCLATGSLWGRPMWGTWWAWDARLTSMLILLFLYLGYIALSNAFDDHARGSKAAAILALAGFVNIPIIKYSVDWWRTLHQPSTLAAKGGPAIDPAMLLPLILMVLGFSAFFAATLLIGLKAELLAARIRALRALAASRPLAPSTPAELESTQP